MFAEDFDAAMNLFRLSLEVEVAKSVGDLRELRVKTSAACPAKFTSIQCLKKIPERWIS